MKAPFIIMWTLDFVPNYLTCCKIFTPLIYIVIKIEASSEDSRVEVIILLNVSHLALKSWSWSFSVVFFSEMKCFSAAERNYWLFTVKAKNLKTKLDVINCAAQAAFLVSCFTFWVFTFILSLYRRHSRRSAPCSRAPRSWLLKEEIYFLFNFLTQTLRARKGSNQRPSGEKKLPFFSPTTA